MKGLLLEMTKMRTPVFLAILLACGVFIGYSYRTQSHRTIGFQKRIAFLEGTISKLTNVEEDADRMEKDFQRKLKIQEEKVVQMNAVLQAELLKMSNKFQLEKSDLLNNVDAKDAIIREKQALLDGTNKEYKSLKLDTENIQRIHSQLLEKFTLQSEKLNMALRLKERCDAKMHSIAIASQKSARDKGKASDATVQALKRFVPAAPVENNNNKVIPPMHKDVPQSIREKRKIHQSEDQQVALAYKEKHGAEDKQLEKHEDARKPF